jgi:branched-chain amino acid transport system ATP-binding protein
MRPTVVKLGAFAVGSALAALGGGLGATMVGFVGPDSYGVFLSIYALLAVILGGPGSVAGSLIGALVITVVPVYAGRSGIPQDLVFGVVLLLVIMFAPDGLAGLARRIPLLQRRSATPDTPAPVEAVETAAAPSAEAPAAEEGTPALLEIRGLVTGYGAEPVLRGLDVTVREGEIVALLGSNGVGKSTLLRTVSGLLAPVAGTVRLRGEDLGTGLVEPHEIARRGIAHVPEGRAIFPDLTVAENLTMGTFARSARAAEQRRARDEVVELFPILGERLAQQAGTLSGGQQQMLAIGRAMMSRPTLLLLDEPSLGLAPVIVEQVFDNLRRIRESGVAVLLVEQNARAALALADHGYVLARGRVALAGTAAELEASPELAHLYLAVQPT